MGVHPNAEYRFLRTYTQALMGQEPFATLRRERNTVRSDAATAALYRAVREHLKTGQRPQQAALLGKLIISVTDGGSLDNESWIAEHDPNQLAMWVLRIPDECQFLKHDRPGYGYLLDLAAKSVLCMTVNLDTEAELARFAGVDFGGFGLGALCSQWEGPFPHLRLDVLLEAVPTMPEAEREMVIKLKFLDLPKHVSIGVQQAIVDVLVRQLVADRKRPRVA